MGPETEQKAAGADAEGVGSVPEIPKEHPDAEAIKKRIMEALREVYDPEIPVNIVDLGLIRDVRIAPDGTLGLSMTLTAVGCPVTDWMRMTVQDRCQQVEGVGEAHVEISFDPPWTPEQLTDDGRDMLQAMGFPV
jgi:metal-sulfur cluster biosynthetic enzyme